MGDPKKNISGGHSGFYAAWKAMAMAMVWLVLVGLKQVKAQQPPPPQITAQPEGATIRVTTSMVLVDIITTDAQTGMPLSKAAKADFRLLDDGREVNVKSFDSGMNFSTRPIALWFVVQCYQKDWNDFGSGFMKEKTNLLKPALAHLDKNDTVGVAHWCDDGTQNVDHIPDRNVQGALDSIETLMKAKPAIAGTKEGEFSLLRCLREVLAESQKVNPQPLPVIVFLYGDHSGMERANIDEIQNELLKRSVMVFGINNGAERRSQNFAGDSWYQPNVAMFLSWRTGGAFFGVKPENFSDALDAILTQLHFRYVLGFTPAKVDGKRHSLKVELSDAGKQKFKNCELKARPEYIPAN